MISSHELEIERGRYENKSMIERIGKCCNMNIVENEFHFALVCPLCTELRRIFIKEYFCHWPSLNKFDDLVMSNSKHVIKYGKIIKTPLYITYYLIQYREMDQIYHISICRQIRP